VTEICWESFWEGNVESCFPIDSLVFHLGESMKCGRETWDCREHKRCSCLFYLYVCLCHSTVNVNPPVKAQVWQLGSVLWGMFFLSTHWMSFKSFTRIVLGHQGKLSYWSKMLFSCFISETEHILETINIHIYCLYLSDTQATKSCFHIYFTSIWNTSSCT